MKRMYLTIKKLLGFSLMYGELATIAGTGPCQRCVGRALADLPMDVPTVAQGADHE